MDGTPYPPPAPQVPPPSAPQPEYPPAAPQPEYPPTAPQPQYDQSQYQQAQPPKKKKTGLIIGIVVGVLLLCCIGTSVAGYLVYRAAEKEVTDTLESDDWTTDDTLDLDSDSTDESATTIDTGWEDFRPEAAADNGYGALEGFHQEVLDEAAATLYPDLNIEDALVRPSADYTTDTLVARATLADNPDVQIAFYLEIENTAAFDSGWTNDPANEEYDYLDYGTAANGREYFWDNTQLVPLMGGITDGSVTDLLAQAAEDFPDGVVYWVEVDGDTGYIEVTRWEAYPDYSAGYVANYTLDGDVWVLDSAEQW